MFFELDEDGIINRIPFHRQVDKSFNRKEGNDPLNDIGKEDTEIENNKNKFLNFFFNDWVEVKKEEKDAKFCLIIYKEYPNIFEIKKIYTHEEESIDKKIYYLKYVKKKYTFHQKRFL